jgi:hypothetical protein
MYLQLLSFYGTLGGIMLIEIWERLCGYDKWIETQAKVDSASEIRKMLGKRFQESPESRSSGRLLFWKDQYNRTQCGAFVTHDISPLYQLLDGETITIRYDPAKPDRYYCRANWLSWAAFNAKAILALAVGGGFIFWRIWVMLKGRAF